MVPVTTGGTSSSVGAQAVMTTVTATGIGASAASTPAAGEYEFKTLVLNIPFLIFQSSSTNF